MPAMERDPLSVLLDAGARRFLQRVYDAGGEWVTTRLADPDDAARAYALSRGIDPAGRDNASTLSGRHKDMRSRWGRAFARSVYYQHRWYGARNVRAIGNRRSAPYSRPLELEIGRHVPIRGIIPAGRLVRARLHSGGQRADQAVSGLGDRERIFSDNGEHAGASSDPAGRDWLRCEGVY